MRKKATVTKDFCFFLFLICSFSLSHPHLPPLQAEYIDHNWKHLLHPASLFTAWRCRFAVRAWERQHMIAPTVTYISLSLFLSLSVIILIDPLSRGFHQVIAFLKKQEGGKYQGWVMILIFLRARWFRAERNEGEGEGGPDLRWKKESLLNLCNSLAYIGSVWINCGTLTQLGFFGHPTGFWWCVFRTLNKIAHPSAGWIRGHCHSTTRAHVPSVLTSLWDFITLPGSRLCYMTGSLNTHYFIYYILFKSNII